MTNLLITITSIILGILLIVGVIGFTAVFIAEYGNSKAEVEDLIGK